jgi:hypothetical protein
MRFLAIFTQKLPERQDKHGINPLGIDLLGA